MSESQFKYLFTLKNAHLSSNSYNFWMQPNIATKFAGYTAWILLWNAVNLAKKFTTVPEISNFFLGDYFFGAPCKLWLPEDSHHSLLFLFPFYNRLFYVCFRFSDEYLFLYILSCDPVCLIDGSIAVTSHCGNKPMFRTHIGLLALALQTVVFFFLSSNLCPIN